MAESSTPKSATSRTLLAHSSSTATDEGEDRFDTLSASQRLSVKNLLGVIDRDSFETGSLVTESLGTSAPSDIGSGSLLNVAGGVRGSHVGQDPEEGGAHVTHAHVSAAGACTAHAHDAPPPPTLQSSAFVLAVIIFFNVAGGPFGIEPSIRAAGNLYAIIGFAAMPFVWALPEVVITYELASRYPCPSGGVRWLEEAFGTGVGFFTGFMGWVGGVSVNAAYSVLFFEYVMSQFFPHKSEDEIQDGYRYLILVLITLTLGYVNYRGLDIIGKATTLIFVVSMAPFVIMIIMGIPKVDPSKWLQTPPPGTEENFDDDSLQTTGWFPLGFAAGVAWRPFLNNLYYNFNNFDQASHFSASVRKKTFQRGLMGTLFIVSTAYLLPILIATGATDFEQDDWRTGALARAASEIGGEWLGGWVVVSSGISLVASFFAEMSADSMGLMGMADRKQMPSIFSHRSRYETPTYGILAGIVVMLILLPFPFVVISELANFSYCFAVMLEFLAFAQLRIRKGDASKLRKVIYVLMFIPPMAYNILVILLASYATYIYGAVLMAVAFILMYAESFLSFCRQCRRKESDATTKLLEDQ